jgi:hypothetical protein
MSWIAANWFDLPFRFAFSFCFDESCHARLRLPRPVRCCGAHVHRIFPNDTIRISMKRTDRALAAVLYGLERERLDPGQRPPTTLQVPARKIKGWRLHPNSDDPAQKSRPPLPELRLRTVSETTERLRLVPCGSSRVAGDDFSFADKETGEKSAMARIATFCYQSKFPRTLSSPGPNSRFRAP